VRFIGNNASKIKLIQYSGGSGSILKQGVRSHDDAYSVAFVGIAVEVGIIEARHNVYS
jgi:hypothetical protein